MLKATPNLTVSGPSPNVALIKTCNEQSFLGISILIFDFTCSFSDLKQANPDQKSPSTENIEIASKDEPDDFTKVELSPKKDTESRPQYSGGGFNPLAPITDRSQSPKKDTKLRPQYSGGGFIEPPRDPLAPINDRAQDVKKSVPNHPLLTKIPPGSKESGVSGDGLARVSQHLVHATSV